MVVIYEEGGDNLNGLEVDEVSWFLDDVNNCKGFNN